MKHSALWRFQAANGSLASPFFSLFFTYPLQTDLTPQPDDVSNKTWNRSAGRLHGFAARLQQVAASVIGINSTSAGAPPQREWSQSGDSPRSSCV